MQFIIENHKIYAQNEAGERLAEVDFPALDENTVSIDHTFVDPSLRGQGVGDAYENDNRRTPAIGQESRARLLLCTKMV